MDFVALLASIAIVFGPLAVFVLGAWLHTWWRILVGKMDSNDAHQDHLSDEVAMLRAAIVTQNDMFRLLIDRIEVVTGEQDE